MGLPAHAARTEHHDDRPGIGGRKSSTFARTAIRHAPGAVGRALKSRSRAAAWRRPSCTRSRLRVKYRSHESFRRPQGDSQNDGKQYSPGHNRRVYGWPCPRPWPRVTALAAHRAPLTDWKPYIIQPQYMAARRRAARAGVCKRSPASVSGLPAQMVPGAASAGPALREAFRQFVALTVQPLGRILEAEVSRVLERPVRLQHHQLASADVAALGRGRSRRSSRMTSTRLARSQLVGWYVVTDHELLPPAPRRRSCAVNPRAAGEGRSRS